MVTMNQRVAQVHCVGRHPKLNLISTLYRDHQVSHGWMDGIDINERLIFGLSTGVGSLYLKNNNDLTPLFIGSNSLNPILDLSMSTGTWVNRRFSENTKKSIEEMKHYLLQKDRPILVAVNPKIVQDCNVDYFEYKKNNAPFPISYCLVTEITDENVTLYMSHRNHALEIPLFTFQEAIKEITNKWVDLIFPNCEIDHTWSLQQSFIRSAHHYQSGWKDIHSGLDGLLEFTKDIFKYNNTSLWEQTKKHNEYLGGDFGRGWYSDHLKYLANVLEDSSFLSISKIYEELSEAWAMFMFDAEKNTLTRNLVKWVVMFEEEALKKMIEIADRKKKMRVRIGQ
jgi:hypothetical protein